jgi:hypothetical protein
MRRASTSDDESSNLSAASKCGDVVQRMRAQGHGLGLRSMRSEFNSLHPLHISLGSRGLRQDDASVLTLFVRSVRSGLDSRREFQGVGSVTEQHGSVRSCKSGFDSRPALQLELKSLGSPQFQNDTPLDYLQCIV